jgi:hypothetical protein
MRDGRRAAHWLIAAVLIAHRHRVARYKQELTARERARVLRITHHVVSERGSYG